MLNQQLSGHNANYAIFVDQHNPFGNANNSDENNAPSEIQSEPIDNSSSTYDMNNSRDGFLCKDIKCIHFNDVLCVVCVVTGIFLSWLLSVTLIFPARRANNTTTFNITN